MIEQSKLYFSLSEGYVSSPLNIPNGIFFNFCGLFSTFSTCCMFCSKKVSTLCSKVQRENMYILVSENEL